MIKANFPPAVVKQETKRQYYNFLNKAQLREEYSQSEDFICEAVFDVIDRE